MITISFLEYIDISAEEKRIGNVCAAVDIPLMGWKSDDV
jgi:hypothetical protein